MHNWLTAEREKLNALIRKFFKRALGLPVRTHTEDLLRLGIHNTMEKIAEAQERAQLTRLSTTPAGRRILEEIGLAPTKNLAEDTQIPREIGEKVVVAPLPRNVHPFHNAGRRKASNILKQINKDKIAASFVDAAAYRDGKAFAVSVVDTLGKVINCASVRTTNPEVAEQVAIALAMQDGRRDRVYSDSKAAIRAFQKGRVARQVVQTLKGAKHGNTSMHSILWFPAHVGAIEGVPLNLNESAHEAACGFTDRAALGSGDSLTGHRDAPLTHNEITKLFYLERRNLQQALDTTEAFLANTGLKLSPSKSELLLCKQGPRLRQPLSSLPVDLHTRDGGNIPRCNTIKVLGMVIGAYSNDNAEALKHITKSTLNFTMAISRVASKRDGLKEDNVMKAFHAFLISHITYAAPFNWKKTEPPSVTHDI
ncbi:uncharacterized protein LOC142590545 [Dermacentor variabilis]|uniref:uncharacterized protein LOC142590545 n=1 Tax=Dermacentor variabilis TaxID=34621 RepID=UPI003F5C7DCE